MITFQSMNSALERKFGLAAFLKCLIFDKTDVSQTARLWTSHVPNGSLLSSGLDTNTPLNPLARMPAQSNAGCENPSANC